MKALLSTAIFLIVSAACADDLKSTQALQQKEKKATTDDQTLDLQSEMESILLSAAADDSDAEQKEKLSVMPEDRKGRLDRKTARLMELCDVTEDGLLNHKELRVCLAAMHGLLAKRKFHHRPYPLPKIAAPQQPSLGDDVKEAPSDDSDLKPIP